ncbi:hypothetical protein ACU8NH_06285 [Rhizobium leguminosarum]|jgi:predicted  nucleic acid-binding Zn-ribbon protein|uniref:hypothetical protein n=1 Tax=Rhizobium TaxID=379 RepID=UPI0010401942|nr:MULTISPECIES: hypothetical protein [Rhizobium]MBY4608982.1 hypothetical protein [Rhizobium croatiense]TBZ34581.1 hypothetical protein E0H36_09045 [Rhizobium leguminosarum bv. viciae]
MDHRENPKSRAPKQAGDEIALLKARIAELEDEIADLEVEVIDLELELEAAPDPDLLADIRSDLEQGDLEYALVRIGRAIGWY